MIARLTVLMLSAYLVLVPAVASAHECSTGGTAGGTYITVTGTCSDEPDDVPGSAGKPTTSNVASPYSVFRWASVCTPDPLLTPGSVDCHAAGGCVDPQQQLWQLWGRLANGAWVTVRTECFGGQPPPVQAQPPTVTAADVLAALRRVGLPELTTQVQPAEKTLVNFDTIFYTHPEPVDLHLTILGQDVHIIATPTTYQWVFGDGTGSHTATPGDPYPAKTITHRYTDAHLTVHPHVEVTYTARYQVHTGDWHDIDGTVTTIGPPTALHIAEAVPLLSGQHR